MPNQETIRLPYPLPPGRKIGDWIEWYDPEPIYPTTIGCRYGVPFDRPQKTRRHGIVLAFSSDWIDV
jgi:hypothetical protein